MRADRRSPGLPTAALCAVAALGLTLAAGPRPAAAQEAGEASDSASAADSAARGSAAAADTGVATSYRREVYSYPAANRPDPFQPPEVGAGMGPRFEDLVLAGIIHAPSIGSVAILKDRTTGKRYRLRDGEKIGAARIVEIRPGAVVFTVQGVLGQRREILQAKKERGENQG